MEHKREFNILDTDWAKEIEEGVEQYTDMLFDAMWATDDQDISETLSGEPFCGCTTCLWREVLFFLVPKIIKGFQAGKLELEE